MIDSCLAHFLAYGDPAYKCRGALYIAFYSLLLLVSGTSYLMTACMNPGRPADIPNLQIRAPSADAEDESREPVYAMRMAEQCGYRL